MPTKPLTTDECSIGEWVFSPAGNELRRGAERRRLEHRAARTLELLCRRRGAIVSQDDILVEVWNGRTISQNSVPIVIKDIRQALGDDARQPRHIETVSKQGYRLLPNDPEPSLENSPSELTASKRGRTSFVLLAVIPVLLAILLIAVGSTQLGRAQAVELIVTDVENATGSSRYQPLAAATGDLIIMNAQELKGVRVLRGTNSQSGETTLTLSTRLILWEGRPTVMMSVHRTGGAVVWTSMTSGDEALVPRDVSAALQDFGKSLQQPRSD